MANLTNAVHMRTEDTPSATPLIAAKGTAKPTSPRTRAAMASPSVPGDGRQPIGS
jgi:hypothetical protein